ncbi:MAG: phosphotransferase family protein [Firmicutes bacterium]|nr:phosphotransferase family protein [Bacillota bacterium]
METSGNLEERLHRLQAYVEKCWPNRGTAILRDFQSITGGWENEVYSFQLAFQGESSGKDLILRVYPGQDGVGKSRREFGIMDLLGRTGFPVPTVYHVEPSLAHLGKPFMLMEKIPGTSLGDLFYADSGSQGELLTLFCQLLVDLHHWNWREHEDVLLLMLPEDRDFALQIKAWQQVAGPGFESAFRWLTVGYDRVVWQEPCLTHCDFHPENILMKDGENPFVIDWGGARLQDFRFDLAWTILLMSTYASKEVGELVLKQYQEISKTKILDIEYFQVVAALRRLLSIYLSARDGAAELGMAPGAEALMMSDMGHIERVYEMFCDHTDLRLPIIEGFLDRLGQ